MTDESPTLHYRIRDLKIFYELLSELNRRLGSARRLADCHGRMNWPVRGVYFFFEAGEVRSDSGTGQRVVRVGTHAITATSRTTLWNRLSQHRGQEAGGGNHRGSVFRLIVGSAIKARSGSDEPSSWGVAADPSAASLKLRMDRAAILNIETPLETEVSRYIGEMPFLWMCIDDPGGPTPCVDTSSAMRSHC